MFIATVAKLNTLSHDNVAKTWSTVKLIFWVKHELAYINLQLFEGTYIKFKTQISDVVFLIIV
jgi:hypothetical protein